MMVERGFSDAEHDRVYLAAFNKTLEKSRQGSAADQAKTWAELKAFGENAAAMATGA